MRVCVCVFVCACLGDECAVYEDQAAEGYKVIAQRWPRRVIEAVAVVRRHFTAAALLNSDFWRKLITISFLSI